jgi:hypothetical protein
MLKFKSYISESFLNEEFIIEDSKHNTVYGDAYETGTVLHIHDNSAAKHNKDREYQASIGALRKKHNAAIASLPSDKAHKALQAAHASGSAYLNSLQKHEGIKPEHIQQVHHTNQGIDTHIGRQVDRPSNPHDLIVKGAKGKKNFLHGASLKATSGTASNNAAGSFERISASHGMNTKTSATWTRGKKNAGLTGKSSAEIKAVKKNPEIIAHNQTTQRKSATAHAAAFNTASHAQQQQHLLHFLKATPDLPYHYVKGEKGGSSTPHHEMEHVKAINSAKSLHATVKNNLVHFHNEHGQHIATTEHRTTHGSFLSPQANFKFGTLKAKA